VHLLLKDMVEITLAVVDLLTSPLDLTTMDHHNLELVSHHNLVHNLLLLKVDLKDLADQMVVLQVAENATATLKTLVQQDLLVKKVYLVMTVWMDNLVYPVKMVLMENTLKLNVKNMENASPVLRVPQGHRELLGAPAPEACEAPEANLVFPDVTDNPVSPELSDLKAPSDLLENLDQSELPEKMPPNSLDYPVLKVNKDLSVPLVISELLEKKDPSVNLVKKENEEDQAKMVIMEIMVTLEKLENLESLVLTLNIVHALLVALTAKLDQVVKAINMGATKEVTAAVKLAQTIVVVSKIKFL